MCIKKAKNMKISPYAMCSQDQKAIGCIGEAGSKSRPYEEKSGSDNMPEHPKYEHAQQHAYALDKWEWSYTACLITALSQHQGRLNESAPLRSKPQIT